MCAEQDQFALSLSILSSMYYPTALPPPPPSLDVSCELALSLGQAAEAPMGSMRGGPSSGILDSRSAMMSGSSMGGGYSERMGPSGMGGAHMGSYSPGSTSASEEYERRVPSAMGPSSGGGPIRTRDRYMAMAPEEPGWISLVYFSVLLFRLMTCFV